MSETRVSRRDALRRAAVAGGAVWAAPAIMSISAVGAAGSGLCATKTTYGAKYEVKDDVLICENGAGNDPCSPTRASFPSGCGEVGPGSVVMTGEDDPWTLNLGPDCTFVSGCSKCGSDGSVAAVGSNGGHTVTFHPCPKDRGGVHAISHIEVIFECCA